MSILEALTAAYEPVADKRKKLSAADVAYIRSQYRRGRGGPTQAELAEQFHVNQSQISRIVNGKRWAA